MAINLKLRTIAAKNAGTGAFDAFDAVAINNTADRVAEINAAGAAVLASLPSDYTTLSSTVATHTNEIDGKMDEPASEGTNGQLLQTDGNGGRSWTSVGAPTDAQVGTAVSTWLTNHPEATTTVQDGSITTAKLAENLANDVAQIDTLCEEIAELHASVTLSSGEDYKLTLG